MTVSGEGPDAMRRIKEEADTHMRVVETLERLAHAEEEAAAAFVDFGMSQDADALLERAAEHYRQAAQITQQVTTERSLQHELMKSPEQEQ